MVDPVAGTYFDMKQELTSDLRNFWKTVDLMQRTSKIRKYQFFQISEKFNEFVYVCQIQIFQISRVLLKIVVKS